MAERGRSEEAYNFIAMRCMALACLAILMPVTLWSSVLGLAGLCVAVVWMATVGARSAATWAAARAGGSSARGAADSARSAWALVGLVAGVGSAVLIGTAVRHLTPAGDWIEDDGLDRPVVGVLVLLSSAIPGIVGVIAAARGSRDDERPPAGASDPARLEPGQLSRPVLRGWQAGLVVALAGVVGVVNVLVLLSVTPLGEWAQGTTGQRVGVSIAMLLAVAAPVLAERPPRARGGRC